MGFVSWSFVAYGLYYEIYRHSFRCKESGSGTGRERERAPTVTDGSTHTGAIRAMQTQLTEAQNYNRNADALTVISRI